MSDSNDRDMHNQSETTEMLKAQVRYAVREEMAQGLSDVVFRRTELGSAGHPGDAALQVCADVLSKELGWDENQAQRELTMVKRRFPR